jgi:hypothetical protein
MVMLENKTRVLLILSQDVLDRARVLAGKATAALKLPVSLQIVLRALIGEGLKRDGHPTLLANIEGQAKAVRHKRRLARRAGGPVGELRHLRLRPSGGPRRRVRRARSVETTWSEGARPPAHMTTTKRVRR